MTFHPAQNSACESWQSYPVDTGRHADPGPSAICYRCERPRSDHPWAETPASVQDSTMYVQPVPLPNPDADGKLPAALVIDGRDRRIVTVSRGTFEDLRGSVSRQAPDGALFTWRDGPNHADPDDLPHEALDLSRCVVLAIDDVMAPRGIRVTVESDVPTLQGMLREAVHASNFTLRRLRKARAQRNALRAGETRLRSYARHLDCRITEAGMPCTCGLDDALAEIAASVSAEPRPEPAAPTPTAHADPPAPPSVTVTVNGRRWRLAPGTPIGYGQALALAERPADPGLTVTWRYPWAGDAPGYSGTLTADGDTVPAADGLVINVAGTGAA